MYKVDDDLNAWYYPITKESKRIVIEKHGKLQWNMLSRKWDPKDLRNYKTTELSETEAFLEIL